MATEVTYAVERDQHGIPYLLVRLQWPDVAEASSPTQPQWKTNRHLFDMLYGSDGEIISEDDAGRLVKSWGGTLP